MDDLGAEILSGLSLGDQVVTHAQFLIDSESNKGAEFARMEGALPDTPQQPSNSHGAHHGDHLMLPEASKSTNAGRPAQPEGDTSSAPKDLDGADHAKHSRPSLESAMPKMTTGLQSPHGDHAEHAGHAAPTAPQSPESHHHPGAKQAEPAHPDHDAVEAPSGHTDPSQDASKQDHSAQAPPTASASSAVESSLTDVGLLGQISVRSGRAGARS